MWGTSVKTFVRSRLVCAAGLLAGAASIAAAPPSESYCERDMCHHQYSACYDTGITLTGCDMLPTGLCKTYQCGDQ